MTGPKRPGRWNVPFQGRTKIFLIWPIFCRIDRFWNPIVCTIRTSTPAAPEGRWKRRASRRKSYTNKAGLVSGAHCAPPDDARPRTTNQYIGYLRQGILTSGTRACRRRNRFAPRKGGEKFQKHPQWKIYKIILAPAETPWKSPQKCGRYDFFKFPIAACRDGNFKPSYLQCFSTDTDRSCSFGNLERRSACGFFYFDVSTHSFWARRFDSHFRKKTVAHYGS